MPVSRVIGSQGKQLAYAQDATARAITAMEAGSGYIFGTPSSVAFAEVYAKWGTLQRCDPTLAGFNVHLPEITPNNVGRSVCVVNIANAMKNIRVIAHGGATINGNATNTISLPYTAVTYLAVSPKVWIAYA